MRLKIFAVLFLWMGLLNGVARGQTSRPETKEHRAWREQRDKEFAEVRAIQSKQVSLEVDVATYCDLKIRDRFPDFFILIKRYGVEAALHEEYRQAKTRKSDDLLTDVLLFGTDYQFPFLHDAAMEGLQSETPSLREWSVNWATKYFDSLNALEKAELAKRVRQLFVESRGTDFGWEFLKMAKAQDLPLLKQIYTANFKDKTTDVEGAESLNSCQSAFSGFNNSRSRMLLAMARLGDAASQNEIRAAVQQPEDVQRRCWGIYLAGTWKDPSVLPLLAKALDDTRVCPERVDLTADPQAKNGHVYRIIRTRVCDLAIRALHEASVPKAKWPFAVSPLSDWMVSESDFSFTQVEAAKFDPARKELFKNVLVGFTDEQIQFVRDHSQAR